MVFRKAYSCGDMMGYIAMGNLNMRIHRDITGEMWFGVGKVERKTPYS
jgi:hypothetical protein